MCDWVCMCVGGGGRGGGGGGVMENLWGSGDGQEERIMVSVVTRPYH